MPTFNPSGTGRTGSTQDWVVPVTGRYRIVAKGARGGWAYRRSSSTVNLGGYGAVIQSEIDLVAGHTIRMMVGQTGGDNPNNSRGGGGGGGTFVVNQTTGTLLLVTAAVAGHILQV